MKRDSFENIAQICRTDTGCHPLDSGGYGGRHHEQPVKKRNGSSVRLFAGDTFFPSISTEHFLHVMLESEAVSDRLDALFLRFANRPKYRDMTWIDCGGEFWGMLKKRACFESLNASGNTCNSDNWFSQQFQYNIFTYKDEDIVAIQIHCGCDLRGGYTRPHFFRLVDEDHFTSWDLNFFNPETDEDLYWDGIEEKLDSDEFIRVGNGIYIPEEETNNMIPLCSYCVADGF